MRKAALFLVLFFIICILTGCNSSVNKVNVAATTRPVYEFAERLCEGTPVTVNLLVTEEVSCLHDYTLQVSQMRTIESADVVIMSGVGLEEFLKDTLDASNYTVDASVGTHTHEADHTHEHDHSGTHGGHYHDHDPHIWLSTENAKIMVENICVGLTALYPEHETVFVANMDRLLQELDALQTYGEQTLSQLSCRELITFHDGFAYFAESFDLTILKAVEEESGSETSASELIELIQIVDQHCLPAIFTEQNGSTAAAEIISAETGVQIFVLDMAMSGGSYFDAMYHNINTIKEALG